jgi:uncharacterized protein YcgI (DUF1989 family)
VADIKTIPPRSGAGFTLDKGQTLTVIDPEGRQVSDLLAYNRADVREAISSGRTLDYASRLYLTTGDLLYSNRSNVMLEIVSDDVGRHDFLLTPCSKETFAIIYGDTDPHRGCFGNLAEALAPWSIEPDQIPVAFNCCHGPRHRHDRLFGAAIERGQLQADPVPDRLSAQRRW